MDGLDWIGMVYIKSDYFFFIKNLTTKTSSCDHFDTTTTVSATAICGMTTSIADTAPPLSKPLAW